MLWLIRFSFCALYPRTSHLPGIADTGVRRFIVRFRRETTPVMRLGISLGALLFVLSPLFTIGVPLPAFWLPKRALDRHAHKIANTSIYVVRQLVFLLKMVASFCWGAHPTVRASFNLPALPPDPGTLRTA